MLCRLSGVARKRALGRHGKQMVKCFVDALTCASRDVEEGNIVFLGEFSHLFARYLMIAHVALVGQEDNFSTVSLTNVTYPILCVQEGVAVTQIKDNGDSLCSANVRRRDAAEAFLAGGVPPHDAVNHVVERGKLDIVVDTNGSNESLCKALVDVAHEQTCFSCARVTQHEHFQLVVKLLIRHGWFMRRVC